MTLILDIIFLAAIYMAIFVLIMWVGAIFTTNRCKHDWYVETIETHSKHKRAIYRCNKCGKVKLKWED